MCSFKSQFGYKISIRSWDFLFLLVLATATSSKGLLSKCFWSSCFDKENENISSTACGSISTTSVAMKEGCVASDMFRGLKYLCCACSQVEFNSSDKSNVAIWPNHEGAFVNVSFDCPMLPLEQYSEKIVQFFLYTKNNNNPFDYKVIKVGDRKSLMKSGFIKNAPVKLIIHGYLTNSLITPTPILRKYYLRRNATVNIISVDWRLVADTPCYNIAANFTRYVGKRSALLLKFILEENLVALKDIHVVGHSIGAHTAGFTGKSFFEYTGHKLPRVTGLDPYAPLFSNKSAEDRIDRSDANFVDIIHTSISPPSFFYLNLSKTILGLEQPLGHVDFYPNKGRAQPGCKIGLLTAICGHYLVNNFFAESIQPPNNKVFRARLCKNLDEVRRGSCSGNQTALMGACTEINNSSSTSLLYYLETNKKSPYAKSVRNSIDYNQCPIS